MKTILTSRTSLVVLMFGFFLLVALPVYAGNPGGGCSNGTTGQGGEVVVCGDDNLPAIVVAFLNATPSTINQGQSSTLSWSATGATGCVGDIFPTGGATAGSAVVTPSVTTTYTLTCSNDSQSSMQSHATVTVVVPDLTATTNGSSVSVAAGSSVSMSGTVTNIGAGTSPASNALFSIQNSGGTVIDNTGNQPTSALSPNASEAKSSSYTFNTPGTYSYRLCADWNGAVSESNESNNCGSMITVTVNAPQPDLSAGSVTPTTATAGSAQSLAAVVSNTGTGSTGSSFSNLFQVRNSSGTQIDSGVVSTAAIAASSNRSVPFSTTFPSAGTYTARLCADANGSMVGTIAESNEGNNCGAWTSIVVSLPPQPDLTMSNASPSGGSFSAGTPVTFQAIAHNIGTGAATNIPNIVQLCNTISGAFSCTTLNTNVSMGTVASLAPSANSTTLSAAYTFNTPGTYAYRACTDNDTSWVGANTESNEGNNCDSAIGFTITSPVTQCNDGIDNDGDGFVDGADGGCSSGADNNEGDNVTCNLSSNPSSLIGGGTATFTWGSTNATTCTGTGFSTGGATSGTSGSVSVPPGGIFQLQCSKAADICTKQTSPASAPTATISATPTRVNAGASVNLSWTTAQCTTVSVTGTNGFSSTQASGTNVSSGAINTQTTFTASCDGGAAANSVVVNVIPKVIEF